MRISTLSSLVLTALFAVTGCSTSATATRISTTPANHQDVILADTSDAMWKPQEEMTLMMDETPSQPTTSRSRNVATAMPTPNQRELIRGQVHAAY